MKPNHVGLWQKLEQFQLDSAEAAFPFSARLARENNWPTAYAPRVIAEYKRFAFLAVAAMRRSRDLRFSMSVRSGLGKILVISRPWSLRL